MRFSAAIYKLPALPALSLTAQIGELITRVDASLIPLHLIFFTKVENNDSYLLYLDTIRRIVAKLFPAQTPLVTLIAQPTLEDCQLVLEVHYLKPDSNVTVAYLTFHATPYIRLSQGGCKLLWLASLMSESLSAAIADQSLCVMDRLSAILAVENMPIHSIVRQWNYIENITAFDGALQNYQAFNDARSKLYDQTIWPQGYPAATGIGTSCGGIVVDAIAMSDSLEDIEIIPLDNSLQVAAHDYSQNVLLGAHLSVSCSKTTPKFERAKWVRYNQKNCFVFISGTAAIRGENSLKGVGIEQQTKITIENIEHLISSVPFMRGENADVVNLEYIRVYLKNEKDMAAAKQVIEYHWGGLSAVYLLADVCRDELLIEIEAVAQ